MSLRLLIKIINQPGLFSFALLFHFASLLVSSPNSSMASNDPEHREDEETRPPRTRTPKRRSLRSSSSKRSLSVPARKTKTPSSICKFLSHRRSRCKTLSFLSLFSSISRRFWFLLLIHPWPATIPSTVRTRRPRPPRTRTPERRSLGGG